MFGYSDHICDGCGATCPNKSPDDDGWNMIRLEKLGKRIGNLGGFRDFAYICENCSKEIFDKFPVILCYRKS